MDKNKSEEKIPTSSSNASGIGIPEANGHPAFSGMYQKSGIDLRYIQEISGYKSSKTTEIYTHVTTKNVGRIKSPLDNLNLKKEIK